MTCFCYYSYWIYLGIVFTILHNFLLKGNPTKRKKHCSKVSVLKNLTFWEIGLYLMLQIVKLTNNNFSPREAQNKFCGPSWANVQNPITCTWWVCWIVCCQNVNLTFGFIFLYLITVSFLSFLIHLNCTSSCKLLETHFGKNK